MTSPEHPLSLSDERNEQPKEEGQLWCETLPQKVEEKQVIKALLLPELVLGASYFLISNVWWKEWKQFVGWDEVETPVNPNATHYSQSLFRPSPINNFDLIEKRGFDELKGGLQEGRDFVIVPEEAWNKFLVWFVPVQYYPKEKIDTFPKGMGDNRS